MSERSIGFELSTRHPSLLPEINNPQPSLTAFTQARRPYPQFVNATDIRTDAPQTSMALELTIVRYPKYPRAYRLRLRAPAPAPYTQHPPGRVWHYSIKG